jgi:hypothetical protein
MLKQHVSSLSSAGSDADMIALEPSPPVALQVLPLQVLPAGHQVDLSQIPQSADALGQTVRDQLAREVADIELATAALRRAEPALESWTKEPVNAGSKPRPVWVLIGVLWLSTALVTAGAVVAIATLAG